MEKKNFKLLLIGILIIIFSIAVVSNVLSSNDNKLISSTNNFYNNTTANMISNITNTTVNVSDNISDSNSPNDIKSQRYVICPICGEHVDTWTTHHTHSHDYKHEHKKLNSSKHYYNNDYESHKNNPQENLRKQSFNPQINYI